MMFFLTDCIVERKLCMNYAVLKRLLLQVMNRKDKESEKHLEASIDDILPEFGGAPLSCLIDLFAY